MARGNVTDEELAELIERNAESASAFIRGDMTTYAALVPHADDFTLMPPFGGEPRRGFDDSEEALAGLAAYFRGGECEVEIFESYTSDDMVVLVAIERQRGVVGDMPEQDWSLRVTLVWRRDDSQWRLVHRHADALVHGISEAQLSALARG
jgi:ketosteroid isomerase-like protein